MPHNAPLWCRAVVASHSSPLATWSGGQTCIYIIHFPSIFLACFLIFLAMLFKRRKNLKSSQATSFVVCTFCVLRNLCLLKSRRDFLLSSFRSFIVLAFTFRFIRFELIFMGCVRWRPKFISFPKGCAVVPALFVADKRGDLFLNFHSAMSQIDYCSIQSGTQEVEVLHFCFNNFILLDHLYLHINFKITLPISKNCWKFYWDCVRSVDQY